MNDIFPRSSQPHLRYGGAEWSHREELASRWAGRLIVPSMNPEIAETFISELESIYRGFVDSDRVIRKGSLTGGGLSFCCADSKDLAQSDLTLADSLHLEIPSGSEAVIIGNPESVAVFFRVRVQSEIGRSATRFTQSISDPRDVRIVR